jgi:hypothetical protein
MTSITSGRVVLDTPSNRSIRAAVLSLHVDNAGLEDTAVAHATAIMHGLLASLRRGHWMGQMFQRPPPKCSSNALSEDLQLDTNCFYHLQVHDYGVPVTLRQRSCLIIHGWLDIEERASAQKHGPLVDRLIDAPRDVGVFPSDAR